MKSLNTLVRIVVCLIAIGTMTACDRLESKHYVGEPGSMFNGYVGSESIWEYDGEVFFVKATGKSTAIASTAQWNEETNAFELTSRELVFTELGGYMFLNVKEEDGFYTILRMAMVGNGIAIFTVAGGRLTEDIRAKKLEAKLPKDSHAYRYSGNKQSLDRYVAKNANTLFDLNAAGYIKPIVEPKKPEESSDTQVESLFIPIEPPRDALF